LECAVVRGHTRVTRRRPLSATLRMN